MRTREEIWKEIKTLQEELRTIESTITHEAILSTDLVSVEDDEGIPYHTFLTKEEFKDKCDELYRNLKPASLAGTKVFGVDRSHFGIYWSAEDESFCNIPDDEIGKYLKDVRKIEM